MPIGQGVTIPQNQGSPRNEGPPNTVTNVSPAQFVAVEYFDGEGRKHRDFALKVGDEYFFAKNGETWTDDLRQVRPWLRDGITKKLPLEKFKGISDSVEVLPLSQ